MSEESNAADGTGHPAIELYYSYAPKDAALFEVLEEYVKQLERQGLVTCWHPGLLSGGKEPEQESVRRFNSAQVILLLLSPAYMASDECYAEMQRAVSRAKTGGVMVAPIVLRPVEVEALPFSRAQLLPTGGRAVTDWPSQDQACQDVVLGLRRILEQLSRSPQPTAPIPKQVMGHRIALLIGNTEYDDPYYRRLVTPGQNVRDLERVLIHPERCGFEVTTLLNASKSEAEKAILDLFKNKTQDDFLVLYFAGHGLKDSDGALYFAMKETERDAIEVTAVPASFVKSRLDKSFSERIVVILDCCFSGAFGGTMSGYGEIIDIQREFEAHGYGRVVLTATDAMQYAWDRNTDEILGEADNSVFTRYLVEGILTGEADRNGDGKITVDALFSYVYQRTVKTFPKQTPKKIVYHAGGDLVFARNPKPSRLHSDLVSAVTHPSHYVRLGAVNELEELLYEFDGKNPQLVEQIQTTLKRLAGDRNKQVSQQASAILNAYSSRAATTGGYAEQVPFLISSPGKVRQAKQNSRRQPKQRGREAQSEANELADIHEVLEPYLNWMIERHSQLELRGIGGDVRLPTIPLEKVYVALKGIRATTYEREQSQELLHAEMSDFIADLKGEFSSTELAQMISYAELRAIILNPYMPSIERDGLGDGPNITGEKASIVTLGDAFREERWMVILGDPGSGKTTLARWIALKLATAWSEESVIVPAYQVDPRIDKTDSGEVNIGPARLPVLLRVSDFANAYERARQNHKTLSIADFLGYHPWLGQTPNLSQQKLNALIKHYLRLGRVVVILDGMDEITVANQRDDIVRSIETFINDWINARGNAISAQEKSFLWNPLVQGQPATTGGNQIIITSRKAGYQARPITGQVTHVIIQPMQQVAVEHFCDAWTEAIHRSLNPKDDEESIQKKTAIESSGLKAAIFDPHRPRIRELASNPLLITILALVYRNNQGRLPEQRTELYHKAMEILVESWRSTGMTTIELVYVLSPLAAHIHQHYSTGLIEENEMKEIITDGLAKFRQLDSFNLPPSFDLEVDDFIRRVREDVGLLAERSNHLYGFLHLTFQEYLAALYLIRDKANAPQAIIDKLDDPRWREPILMALGHMSTDWGPKARRQLLTALLDADDPLGDLIPRSALLIVSAIPEMAQVSEDVVREIIRRLLSTYADRDGIGQFSTLLTSVSSSFKSLYNSSHRQLLEQYLAEIILHIENGDRNLALASASLIVEHKWQSGPLLKALLKAFPYDDPAWEYPITRALRAIALNVTEGSDTPLEAEKQSSLLIDSDALPFRKSLEGEPELVEYIKHNLDWLRLVVLLYGGISDDGLATYAIQYDEIAAVLSMEDSVRLYHIDRLRERDYWRESWDDGDVVYNLAVYLDTECGKLSKNAKKYVPQFNPAVILNDSPLTAIVLNALRQKKHPSTLKNHLWHEWHTSSHEVRRAHALLALLMIDTQQAMDTLTQSLKETTTSALAELVLNQLRLRKHTLADALILLGNRAEVGTSLEPLQGTLENDQWGDLVEVFFRTFTSIMPLPVGRDEILFNKTTSIPRINAEIWAYWLSGLGVDDPIYNFAVVLDTIGKKIESASALINMELAHNRKYDTFTQWHPVSIPPVYDNYADVVGEALTIAHQSKSEAMKSLFYQGTIVYAMSAERAKTGVSYQDYPGLKEDALAATLLIPFEFQREIIEGLEAELARVSVYEFTNRIIERVVSIADDVIRSRSLWRAAQASQYRGYWNNLNLWDLSIEAAEQIGDPLHRSRAFERLIDYVPQRLSERLKEESLDAARKISDPNNRARALARLALYETNEDRWMLLSDALTAAEEITDEQQLVDTIQLIHPYLAENHQLNQMHDGIIKHIKNDWYRSKGNNLLSLQLLILHDKLHEPQKLTPVVLASIIDEIVNLQPQETAREELWSHLLDPARRQQALSALLKTASANGLDGLHLTPSVFEVIRSLLESQEISAIYMLLPYLRGAERSLLPLLNLWIDNPPDKVVWTYAGLLLAEAGQVDQKTIPCLLELIEHGIDFGRYRANIVLHGSSVIVQKINRDFRTSRLGMQSLLLLAQAQKRLLAERVSIAAPLRWAWDNVIHDDPHVLRQLIEYANTEEGMEAGVFHILKHISYCDDNTLQAFVDQFEGGSEKTQGLLLHSWFNLSMSHFKGNIAPEQQKRMEDAISKLPSSILESIKIIPERLNTVSTLLCSVSRRVEEKDITFQEAISLLNQELTARSLRLPDTPIEALVEHILYNLNDPQRALEAAQAVSESGTALELLFAWLAASLREDIDDYPPIYYRTSTLLELAGATTRFSPAAIYNLNEKNELGQLLVQATLLHRYFCGRAGAATLLGYLRQTPGSFHEALLSGLDDVADVQTAILQMVQNLRYLDERVIPRLMDLLEHESASVVYASSRLLTSIARNEKLSFALRQRIIRTLKKAIHHTSSSRPVFILVQARGSVFMHAIGRLDQQLYSAIIDIIGIA